MLEQRGKLLRMYSQNIDTLEQKAGIERVIQCHGSFSTATCTDPQCGYHVDGRVIREDIMAKRVPLCPRCEKRREEARQRQKRRKLSHASDSDEDEDDGLAYGVMKPDITFFGEKLPDAFEKCVWADRNEVDLILVMGTSLKVAPVADLLTHLPSSVPTVLINRTPITHMATDVMLLGDSDPIVGYLCQRLGWPWEDSKKPEDTVDPQQAQDAPHIWLFPSAEYEVEPGQAAIMPVLPEE